MMMTMVTMMVILMVTMMRDEIAPHLTIISVMTRKKIMLMIMTMIMRMRRRRVRKRGRRRRQMREWNPMTDAEPPILLSGMVLKGSSAIQSRAYHQPKLRMQ